MANLSSRSNPKIKQIRALLQQRKVRRATGLFVAEGIRHVGEAVEAGAALEYVCYAPELLSSEFASGLIQELPARGVPCLAVTADLFADLAEKDNPPGILAVVRQPNLTLEQLQPATAPWLVALVAPQDPGNIGTILRTIDAVGASGLLLLDQSADPYHPSAVRASMGTIFWLPVLQAKYTEFAAWAPRHGYTIYGTSAHASRDYQSIEYYASPRILLMGSERQGLTVEQAAICHELLSLPMKGHTTSLNLAVATGVMMYAMLSCQLDLKSVSHQAHEGHG
jgi:TrmH family RNA methyltransferase